MRQWMHGVMEPSYMHKWNERKARAWAYVCVCVCVCVCGRGRVHGSCEMLSVLKLLEVHTNSQFTATPMH